MRTSPHLGCDGACTGVCRRRRERDDKRCAGAGPRGNADLAAVGDDDAANECEPEPMALNLPFDGVCAAVERLENMREVGSRDARTMIADGNTNFGAPAL